VLATGVVGPAILVLRCVPADAQEHQNSLQPEIAQVEQQVDSIESDALATIPSLVPGSPERLPRLGKILFPALITGRGSNGHPGASRGSRQLSLLARKWVISCSETGC
jgi:hypothetical protein